MTEIDRIIEQILAAAEEVYRGLGPGLMESAYEVCLAYELGARGISYERQVALPVIYKGVRLDCGYLVDLVAEQKVAVEIKAVDVLLPAHDAQLKNYLKLGGWLDGLLINFNEAVLKDGVHHCEILPRRQRKIK